MFRAAESILREFGNLSIKQSGAGEFHDRASFEFTPTLATGEGDRFRRFVDQIGGDLFPLGEAADGYLFLAVAEDGRVFILMDEIWLVGATIDVAIEVLVHGRKPTRYQF